MEKVNFPFLNECRNILNEIGPQEVEEKMALCRYVAFGIAHKFKTKILWKEVFLDARPSGVR